MRDPKLNSETLVALLDEHLRGGELGKLASGDENLSGSEDLLPLLSEADKPFDNQPPVEKIMTDAVRTSIQKYASGIDLSSLLLCSPLVQSHSLLPSFLEDKSQVECHTAVSNDLLSVVADETCPVVQPLPHESGSVCADGVQVCRTENTATTSSGGVSERLSIPTECSRLPPGNSYNLNLWDQPHPGRHADAITQFSDRQLDDCTLRDKSDHTRVLTFPPTLPAQLPKYVADAALEPSANDITDSEPPGGLSVNSTSKSSALLRGLLNEPPVDLSKVPLATILSTQKLDGVSLNPGAKRSAPIPVMVEINWNFDDTCSAPSAKKVRQARTSS
jgi:hypothetical protein